MTVSLSDKYDLTKNQIYVSGTQAVIRMLLMQKARDEAAGLKTSGFISGYRGSPLGGLDLQIGRAGKALSGNDIHFEAGINEGDVVVIHEQTDADNGDIVVALVEDQEATLKYLRKKGSAIALEAANPAYETRVYRDDQVKVQGKLVGLIRTY